MPEGEGVTLPPIPMTVRVEGEGVDIFLVEGEAVVEPVVVTEEEKEERLQLL